MQLLNLLIIIIFAVGFLYFIYEFFKKKKSPYLERTLKRSINTIGFIGLLFTFISLIYAILQFRQSNLSPEYEISLITQQGDYYASGSEDLYVYRDSLDNIHYGGSIPEEWAIQIANVGTKTAKNILIKLEFDNISFIDEYVFDFRCEDYQVGVTGWQTLIYKGKSILLPNETFSLPTLPFGMSCHINAVFEETPKPTFFTIKLSLFADDVKKLEKDIKIKINKLTDSDLITDSEDEENKMFSDFLKSISPEGENLTPISFFFDPYLKLKIPNKARIEDLRFAYLYSLGRINPENRNDLRHYALFLGREYYRRLNISDSQIENAIQNDIWAYQITK